jgi:peptidoglycan/LPS O-acetylase OafA/YrhL
MTAALRMVASIQNGGDWFFAGCVGGFCGSVLSLIALWLPGLHGPDDRRRRLFVVTAVVSLTLLGGLAFIVSDRTQFDEMAWTLYLPWQIVFAFFLSRLLPASPPRRAEAPPAAAEPLA